MSDYCPQCGQPHDHLLTLGKYCELTGETPDSVRNLRRSNAWVEGVEYGFDPKGRIWINYTKAEEWRRRNYDDGSQKASESGSTSQAA